MTVIHSEQNRHVLRLVREDVSVDPLQSVPRLSTAHAGVVEHDPLAGEPRVEEVFDVLRIKTLVGDAIP